MTLLSFTDMFRQLNQKKAVRGAKSAVATILILKTYKKWYADVSILVEIQGSLN